MSTLAEVLHSLRLMKKRTRLPIYKKCIDISEQIKVKQIAYEL